MKLKELSSLFQDAVINGAQKALADSRIMAVQMSKADAYRLYGRSHVDRWINEGLISPMTDNGHISKKCIDSKQLEAVAAASNRITYMPVADRKG